MGQITRRDFVNGTLMAPGRAHGLSSEFVVIHTDHGNFLRDMDAGYFGRLYNVAAAVITTGIDNIIDLVHLPCYNAINADFEHPI